MCVIIIIIIIFVIQVELVCDLFAGLLRLSSSKLTTYQILASGIVPVSVGTVVQLCKLAEGLISGTRINGFFCCPPDHPLLCGVAVAKVEDKTVNDKVVVYVCPQFYLFIHVFVLITFCLFR